jgi:hypothetical protein
MHAKEHENDTAAFGENRDYAPKGANLELFMHPLDYVLQKHCTIDIKQRCMV